MLKKHLSCLRSRLGAIKAGDDEMRLNVIRGMVISEHLEGDDKFRSVLALHDDVALRRLVSDARTHHVWVSCMFVSRVLGSNNASHSCKSCVAVYPDLQLGSMYLKKIIFSGLTDDQYMPTTGYLEMTFDSATVLYRAEFWKGIVKGSCMRVIFRDHAEKRERIKDFKRPANIPEVLEPTIDNMVPVEFFYGVSENYVEYGLLTNPGQNVLRYSSYNHTLIFDDDALYLDNEPVFYGRLKYISHLLYHIAVLYVTRSDCSEFEPYVHDDLHCLQNKLSTEDVQVIGSYVQRAPHMFNAIIRAYGGIVGICEASSNSDSPVLKQMLHALRKQSTVKVPSMLHFGVLWLHNMMHRWRRCSERQRTRREMQRSKVQKLREGLRRYRSNNCRGLQFYFTIFKAGIRQHHECQVKQACFGVMAQLVRRRRVLSQVESFEFVQKRWYEFDCVYVRDYPRNPYTGKVETSLVGYMPSKHRNHWWPLTGYK